jgi:Ca2+-transporting ATPase
MTVVSLSVEEAARRLAATGTNQIRVRPSMPVRARVAAQLRDPLVLVLLAACFLTLATGDLADAAVIALVVVANTTVGVVQEVRADQAVAALAAMTAPTVRVRRGGVEQPVPSADLVPGDIVLLGEGDVVPADGEVVEAASLLVDESALTGESVPVGHRPRHQDAAGEDVSAGTVVVKGRAVIEVSRTGTHSALGRIAALTDVRPGPTPLQLRMAQLGRVLAVTAVALCTVVLVLGLAHGEPTELMVVTAISLAVAAVPESLPAVVAIALAMGARRMATRHAIVRRLPAVETLGSVTVLATDKTGTLTQGVMLVEELVTPSGPVHVSAAGEPTATFLRHGQPVRTEEPELRRLLEAAVLCNDARLPNRQADSRVAGFGDPTEVALLLVAARAGLTREGLVIGYPRVGEQPFDSVAQEMTTVHAIADRPGVFRVVRKGAPEALARRHRARSDKQDWDEALRRTADLAARGHRVLAIEAADVHDAAANANQPLVLLGLVAMLDPAKPAASKTIAACREAGIVPVLVTGDHPATAFAIAQRVGVVMAGEADDPGIVATGDEIAAGEIRDLTVPRVFARTPPEQKLDIIRAWQDRGSVVAMTGDGVNDGPALRRADIGVAMGYRGTEVAKQAADMVLADDELTTVQAAVEEGRRVYDNIRRFLVFGLAGGAAEILVMLVGPFTGLVVPLVAAQILWVNLLTHGLTGVAMGAEPVEEGVMRRPPRPPAQSVLGSGLWQRVLLVGAVIAASSLLLGILAQQADRPWQSMLFLALTCMQLGAACGLRPVLVTRVNPGLPVAVMVSFILALAGIYVPVLQDLLSLRALPPGDLVLATATGLVGWAAVRITQPAHARPGASIRAQAVSSSPS